MLALWAVGGVGATARGAPAPLFAAADDWAASRRRLDEASAFSEFKLTADDAAAGDEFGYAVVSPGASGA